MKIPKHMEFCNFEDDLRSSLSQKTDNMELLQRGTCNFCGEENKWLYALCNSAPYCEDCVTIVLNDCKRGLKEFQRQRKKR